MNVLWCDRLIFVRYHRGIHHATDQRLITVVIAADRSEFHFGIGDIELRQRRPRQHVGHGIRS
jgi:hypothetical protein